MRQLSLHGLWETATDLTLLIPLTNQGSGGRAEVQAGNGTFSICEGRKSLESQSCSHGARSSHGTMKSEAEIRCMGQERWQFRELAALRDPLQFPAPTSAAGTLNSRPERSDALFWAL